MYYVLCKLLDHASCKRRYNISMVGKFSQKEPAEKSPNNDYTDTVLFAKLYHNTQHDKNQNSMKTIS